MPAVTSGKILVTGASGFIAVHVVQQLLEKGFSVRGTVRSQDKGEYLQKLFSKYGDKFEYVIVEDIEKDNAFDEAVKGVDGVEHTASPFHFNAEDPKELVGPAVQGTVGVLKSIKKNAPSVKRVVVTSSVASILEPREQDVWTEKDWNQFSIDEVNEKGKDASPQHKYRASKSLAERAAWKFVEDEKPAFDLATVNPPLVLGPIIHQVSKLDSLNTSIAQFYDLITGKKQDGLDAFAGNAVDVRDVATTHVLALTSEQASGERFISASERGKFSWQDAADALHDAFPDDEYVKANVPVGKLGVGKQIAGQVHSSAKAQKELGQKFTEQEKTFVDTYKSLRERQKEWGL